MCSSDLKAKTTLRNERDTARRERDDARDELRVVRKRVQELEGTVEELEEALRAKKAKVHRSEERRVGKEVRSRWSP